VNTIRVNTSPAYDVKIETGLMNRLGSELLAVLGKTCKIAILTDDTVDGIYGRRIEENLVESGFDVCRFAMPHGEEHKNLQWWGRMLEFLAEQHLTRSDCIVALGGGVPGDMAGFAAACYLRSIAFVQVPTTLLAMVDSSVGGKTGLDLQQGKNLAGAFYQPRAVFCDPEALLTLPEEILIDGAAECVKYGILDDEPLFALFEEGQWKERMEEVIARCIRQKAELVEMDEKDRGSRQLLNLGHTFGHAIEKCSDFGVSHGKGVAIGMVMAARLANKLDICDAGTLDRIVRTLQNMGLPTWTEFEPAQLLAAALSDKKRAGNKITLVLPERIGHCELKPIPLDRFAEWMQLAAQ